MTARAIGVFALVLALASPAMAGPANSVIGAKKLEQDMVHSGGAGFPNITYEWWNKGKGELDWAISADLAYGDWGAAVTPLDAIKIGLGLNGILRLHILTKKKAKVTNDFALIFKPGILIGTGTFTGFTFGIKGEIGAPFSIDIHDRVTLVTGAFLPIEGFIVNGSNTNFGLLPILIRLGVEIDATERLAPWFYFDLGPGIRFGKAASGAGFAFRLAAGTAFWGVLGKNKNKSDSAATAAAK